MKTIRRNLGYLAYLCLITTLLIFACEGVIRLSMGDRINTQYISNGLYLNNSYAGGTAGWLPNARGSCSGAEVIINSQGLRGPELRCRQDQERILLLGDSVLFGMALAEEQTLPALLRAQLDACIINTAVIGYSTADYVNVLDRWLEKEQPGRVLLFYCLNDADNGTTRVQQAAWQDWRDYVLFHIRSRSKLYMFLKNAVSDRSKVYFLNDLRYYDPQSEAFINAMHDLATMQQRCQAQGVEFRVIILPYEFQLRYRDNKNYWQPQSLMIDFMKRQRIDYLAIDFPQPSAAALQALYLYADGIHFSKLGHQQIAAKIVNLLR